MLLSAGPSAFELAMQERDAGALFVANLSGGKDGQVMFIHLLEHIPAAQLLAVHATLGESEWPGALEHAQAQAEAAGVPFLVAQAGKTFLGMVERRFESRPEVPSWPSAATRQCTSDLKRGPIERIVRQYAAAHGYTRIVNCMGMRAAESPARARKATWSRNDAQSLRARSIVKTRRLVPGREWHNWLPIHDLSTVEVLGMIRDAGQQLHPAYALGNERLSCVFCVMASAADLRNGAVHNPELYARYVEMEKKTGYTLHMSRRSLQEITGVVA